MRAHKFAVGQAVRFSPDAGQTTTNGRGALAATGLHPEQRTSAGRVRPEAVAQGW